MKNKTSVPPIEKTPAFKLAQALKALVVPIQIARFWIGPEDLPGFEAEIEERIRALQALIENRLRLSKHGMKGDRFLTGEDLQKAREYLDSVNGGRRGRASRRIVNDELSKALLGGTSSTDFPAEAEELRQLRSGELKLNLPRGAKRI